MEEFDLQPGEHVITSVRLHPFVLVLNLLPFVLLALVPWLLSLMVSFALSSGVMDTSTFPAVNESLLTLATGFWWLFIWMAAFMVFTRYFLTLWVITNTRIVDIRQYGFFSRGVSSFLLARVQDVTTDIHGVLGTLIGFGRLRVQTAGHDEDFFLENMPHPQQIRDVIMDQVSAIHHASAPNPAGL